MTSDTPVDPYADPSQDPVRRILRRVLRELLIATAVIALVGLPGGYLVDRWEGLFGALLGVLVALVFTGTTALSMLYAVRKPLTVLAGVVLGAWVGKMVVLVAALAALQDQTFYDKVVFAVVLFAAVLTSMAIDVRAVVKARLPNVDPATGTGPK